MFNICGRFEAAVMVTCVNYVNIYNLNQLWPNHFKNDSWNFRNSPILNDLIAIH